MSTTDGLPPETPTQAPAETPAETPADRRPEARAEPDDLATEIFDDARSDARSEAPDAKVDDAAPDAAFVGGVDPRMKERWVLARRVEGRRRLRVLVSVVAVASVLAFAYVIARSPLLGADTIKVDGATRTGVSAVRTAADIADGEPLVFLDAGAVARRVERLPFVQSAQVETSLPNTVTITVREREPIAWVAAPAPNPVAVLDRTGRVLERVATPPAPLTEVTGITSAGPPGSRVSDPSVFRGLGTFPPELRMLAARLRVERGEVVVVVRGPDPIAAEIRMGTVTDVRAKAAAAIAVIGDLQARGERVQYVDVRVPNAPATR